jgi:hypothetical protein
VVVEVAAVGGPRGGVASAHLRGMAAQDLAKIAGELHQLKHHLVPAQHEAGEALVDADALGPGEHLAHVLGGQRAGMQERLVLVEGGHRQGPQDVHRKRPGELELQLDRAAPGDDGFAVEVRGDRRDAVCEHRGRERRWRQMRLVGVQVLVDQTGDDVPAVGAHADRVDADHPVHRSGGGDRVADDGDVGGVDLAGEDVDERPALHDQVRRRAP